MQNKLKTESPEWEALEILANLTTPARDAESADKWHYWINLRNAAYKLITAVGIAARDCGVAEEKHRHENEDYTSHP